MLVGGMKSPTCFYMLAIFRLVFKIRIDMLTFLVKRPWGQNVSLLQILEVIYTFSDSDFLDMKLLIDSITYLKQHRLPIPVRGALEHSVSSTL